MRALAALVIIAALLTGSAALAKDGCTQSWPKGKFRTSQEIKDELEARLADAKILRLSLCTVESTHYFLVTVLEAAGKVRVIKLPAD